jgi:hypothetical protein
MVEMILLVASMILAMAPIEPITAKTSAMKSSIVIKGGVRYSLESCKTLSRVVKSMPALSDLKQGIRESRQETLDNRKRVSGVGVAASRSKDGRNDFSLPKIGLNTATTPAQESLTSKPYISLVAT